MSKIRSYNPEFPYHSKPFVLFYWKPGKKRRGGDKFKTLRLMISSGAGYQLGLSTQESERVDVSYTEYDEVYKCPVLMIQRGGSQVSLFPRKSTGEKSDRIWAISVTRIVRQLNIPTPPHRLPILDYVDGKICIDLSVKTSEELTDKGLWRGGHGTSMRTTVGSEKVTEVGIRTTKEFMGLVDDLAHKEGKSKASFVFDAVQWYIEDVYAERFEKWKRSQGFCA